MWFIQMIYVIYTLKLVPLIDTFPSFVRWKHEQFAENFDFPISNDKSSCEVSRINNIQRHSCSRAYV